MLFNNKVHPLNRMLKLEWNRWDVLSISKDLRLR